MRTFLFYTLLALVLSGCSPSPSQAPTTPTAGPVLPVTTATPTPEDPIIPLDSSRTETPAPAPATAPAEPPTAQPEFSRSFPLDRPILPPGREIIDPTYRFSTTQGGLREPHHGVEFLNSQGTPVSAAATGTVVFAGDDYNGSPYSPRGWYAFYGLFVVLEHNIQSFEKPVYTLYGHLSDISVTEGDIVHTGQPIGIVGFTGAAVGSHLHFEVRYGGTTYADVRNPELWLQPQEDNGSLAGSITDAAGLPLPVFMLQLTATDGTGYTQYFSTYEEPAVAYQAPFYENFAIGNLPPGTYELSFIAYTLETHPVEIRPGERTFLDITIGAAP